MEPETGTFSFSISSRRLSNLCVGCRDGSCSKSPFAPAVRRAEIRLMTPAQRLNLALELSDKCYELQRSWDQPDTDRRQLGMTFLLRRCCWTCPVRTSLDSGRFLRCRHSCRWARHTRWWPAHTSSSGQDAFQAPAGFPPRLRLP